MNLRLFVCILALTGLVAVARAEDKPAAADPAAKGKDLVTAKKCSVCHSIDGKGGKMAGSLNGVADGKTDEWLTGAIVDPKKTLGDKTKMPSYKDKFSEDEVKDVVAYLKTLKK